MPADEEQHRIYLPSDVSDNYRRHSATAQINQISAGAISGLMTRFLTQPFDVLKIRFQLQVEPVSSSQTEHKSKYTSMNQAVNVILREEGIRGFWKGHNAGQFMSIIFSVAQFWSYEQVHLIVKQMPWLGHHQHVAIFVSGTIAGSVATVASIPFDVIRTRVVAQDHGAGYRSLYSAFPTILRNEGVSGLFRGLGLSVVQIGPMIGANFMFYKSLNEFAGKLMEPADGLLPTWVLLVNGGVAGAVAKGAVYPLDFVKKRIQLQGFENQRQTYGRNQGCKGMMDCVRLTVREEGLLGFYKGMIPTLWKSGFTSAFYFSIYDRIKLILKQHYPSTN